MGMSMTLPAALTPAQSLPVTPLMAFLAPGHSEALARIWPAPHEAYLLLPAARRHAAAILLGRSDCYPARIQWLCGWARDGELAVELFGPHPPGGVMKALGRMGEVLWKTEDYRLFQDLFREETAQRLMRHMPVLQPEVLGVMAVLPPPLRQVSVLRILQADQPAAADLSAAFALALRIRGDAAACDIAQRFGRAKNWRALFEMAQQAIQPLALATSLPPPELPASFQPVRRLEMLASIALEFRNCLRDYVADLASGRMAVWVWRGQDGPAAIALRRDPAGWRLAEARGRDNAPLSDEALMEVVAAVRAAGGRTGEAWSSLYRRLEDRLHQMPGDDLPPPLPEWREQLMLGYLWD